MEPELVKNAPGILGSLTAVFLLKDTWPRRLLLFLAGWVASRYGAPWVSFRLDMDPEVAGFLTGLFSMAIVAKLFEMIEAVNPKELLDRLLQKVGL